jgi:hypothetical protein
VETARGPVVFDPLVAFVPLQPPEAVHEVALVELHVSVEAPPLAIDVGLAARLTVAAPAIVTVAVAIVLAPPAPLQINENDVVAVRAPVLCVPLAVFVPVQPPEAVHAVALVELQVRFDEAPLFTLVGIALIVALGVIGSVELLLLPPQAAMRSAAYAGNNRRENQRDFCFAGSALLGTQGLAVM